MLTIPNIDESQPLIEWLSRFGPDRRFGVLRTPNVQALIVMPLDHVASMDAILSDERFVTLVESGVSDLKAGRKRTVGDESTLRVALGDEHPVDPDDSMVVTALALQGVIRGIEAEIQENRLSIVETPDGKRFVAMPPQQVAEFDIVLSDPALAEAVERGVADVLARRVVQLPPGASLRAATSTDKSALADAVEKGVDDVRAGRVSKLGGDGRLSDLL